MNDLRTPQSLLQSQTKKSDPGVALAIIQTPVETHHSTVSTIHPKQIRLLVAGWSEKDRRQQRLESGGFKSRRVRTALDHENRDEAGFSYQTNKSHMGRKRHQRSTLGTDVESRVRDHGSS